MKNKVKLLRIAYWLGAIFDALTIIPMLIPSIGGKMFGISNFAPGVDYKYAMGIGASLMLGWTMLLIWADRKPKERSGIILLTVFPVLTGLFIFGLYAVNSGMVKFEKMLPILVFQIIISAFFLYCYIANRGKNE